MKEGRKETPTKDYAFSSPLMVEKLRVLGALLLSFLSILGLVSSRFA